MTTYEHNRRIILILLLQPVDVRKRVQAVYAAVGPEIDDYDFTAEFSREFHFEGVKPLMIGRKLLYLKLSY